MIAATKRLVVVELALTALSNGAFNRFGRARHPVRADYVCSALAPKESERFDLQRTAHLPNDRIVA
jgi:hypothetical protein